MSFGYSVGDVLAGANLAYRLLQVMTDSKGASAEYQDAILELGAMQQAFMQVSQMKRNMIPDATVNAATHIVMSSIDLISKFLDRTQKYQQRLSDPRGFGIQSSWCRVGWTLYTCHELRSLRDGLHSKLSSVHLLLSAASYSEPLPATVAQYRVDDTTKISNPPAPASSPAPSSASLHSPEHRPGVDIHSQIPVLEPTAEATTGSNDAITTSRKCTFREETPSKPGVEDRLKEIHELVINLSVGKGGSNHNKPKEPIHFKDAIGRKFTFPFEFCKTWQGMEDLIKQAFLHVEVIGPHVQEGHYDLVGKDGTILLPVIWERMIRPDDSISMHMWPMDRTTPLGHQQHEQRRQQQQQQQPQQQPYRPQQQYQSPYPAPPPTHPPPLGRPIDNQPNNRQPDPRILLGWERRVDYMGREYLFNHTTKETRLSPRLPPSRRQDPSQMGRPQDQKHQQHQHQHRHQPPPMISVHPSNATHHHQSQKKNKRKKYNNDSTIPASKATNPKTKKIIKDIIAKGEISSENWEFLRKNLTRRDIETLPVAELAEIVGMLPDEMRREIMRGGLGRGGEIKVVVGVGDGDGDSACYPDGGEEEVNKEEEEEEGERRKDGEGGKREEVDESGSGSDEWEDDEDDIEGGDEEVEERERADEVQGAADMGGYPPGHPHMPNMFPHMFGRPVSPRTGYGGPSGSGGVIPPPPPGWVDPGVMGGGRGVPAPYNDIENVDSRLGDDRLSRRSGDNTSFLGWLAGSKPHKSRAKKKKAAEVK